ncbi:sugar ABC transporter substrate-binding protein [Microbacterium trichothecenolyticum]|uniref:Ribose transport system substrate-binding protein n=1 Tax=Microbacterium trichothecenolyticum TaxID=69370 RepID=A0ABU0U0M0_MICTR|nr:sugar ABC transporter substrate-binding protein [Microbacterium trichothecenolyticum]MDQ1124772.1 ribose transport system substrate-binding protein [Microbacterium trichothecenolyticum]
MFSIHRGRRHVRKAAAAALAIAALALGGCSAPSDPSSSTDASHTIAISFPNYSKTPAVQIEMKAAEEEAAKQGYTLVLDDPGSDLDKQVSTIKTWIPQGYAAIVAVALDATVMEGVAKDAVDAGVKWITYGSSLKSQSGEIDMQQEAGGRVLGELAGKWFTENLGGQGTVAILGYQQAEWARGRVDGIKAGLAATAPAVKVVDEQDALSETEGLDVSKNLLQAYPDLNGILAVEDPATVGAYQALSEKNSPTMFLGGMDGTETALKAIAEGGAYRASASLDLPSIGRGMVTSAIAAATGTGDSVFKVTYTPVTPGSAELQQALKQWQ